MQSHLQYLQIYYRYACTHTRTHAHSVMHLLFHDDTYNIRHHYISPDFLSGKVICLHDCHCPPFCLVGEEGRDQRRLPPPSSALHILSLYVHMYVCMYVCMYVSMYLYTFKGRSVEAFEQSLGSFATGGRSLVAVSCLKEDHKSSIRFSSCFSVLFLSSSSTCLASSSVTTDPVGALSFLRTRATHHHEYSQNTKISTLCTNALTSLATSGEEAASSQGASASTTPFMD